jgi:hypothetical protein
MGLVAACAVFHDAGGEPLVEAGQLGQRVTQRALLLRFLGPLLGMGIMARSAHRIVGVDVRLEAYQNPLHLVTGCAILQPRNQCLPNRVEGRSLGHRRGELMARDAMKARLTGHVTEYDLGLVGSVAP